MTESRKRKFETIGVAEDDNTEPISKRMKLVHANTEPMITMIINAMIISATSNKANESCFNPSLDTPCIQAPSHANIGTESNSQLIETPITTETQTPPIADEQEHIEESETIPESKVSDTDEDIDLNIDNNANNTETCTQLPTAIDPYKQYNWEQAKIVLRATSTFADLNQDHYKYLDGGNFLKSIYWSPNGFHLLSNSNDRRLRIYNPLNDIYYGTKNDDNEERKDTTPEMHASVVYEHREPIYDIAWYPLFKTNDYASNVFLSCSRDSPIMMFDSWHNHKRCSYSHTFGDCMVTPYSVAFDSFGEYIYGGYKKYIIQFATNKSGSECTKKIKCVNKNKFGQKSIISCIKFVNNNKNVFASGSYDGMAQLFDVRCTFAVSAFKCIDEQNNGITDISFSPCGNYLLCGSRRSNDINCWDLRTLKSAYYVNGMFENELNYDTFNGGNTRVLKDNDKRSLCAKYKRNIMNNQRVQFDIDKYSGYWIVSGNQNGNYCTVYDVSCSDFDVEAKYRLKHEESVSSVSSAQICPTHPFLATTIGQRVLTTPKRHVRGAMDSASDSESDTDSSSEYEQTNINDICIWDLRYHQT